MSVVINSRSWSDTKQVVFEVITWVWPAWHCSLFLWMALLNTVFVPRSVIKASVGPPSTVCDMKTITSPNCELRSRLANGTLWLLSASNVSFVAVEVFGLFQQQILMVAKKQSANKDRQREKKCEEFEYTEQVSLFTTACVATWTGACNSSVFHFAYQEWTHGVHWFLWE